MTITFHGAAQCVTGSKHLVALNSGTKILLDCGMFQGNPKESDRLNRQLGFEPAEVEFLLLSHAHIDHCGLIPSLVKKGFSGTIYCTPATFDLTNILLMDSAQIQENDVAFINKKRMLEGRSLLEPIYTTDDVYAALSHFKIVPINETIRLTNEASFTFTEVGHIIGSAAINLHITEDGKKTTLAFSGDVGRYNDEILNAPAPFPQADYILIESTYGDSLHEDMTMSDKRLLEIVIDTCVERKGKLIIPAFSVGRTQELVYAFNRLEISNQLPDIDFYVDSPLSVEATGVMRQHPECYNQQLLDYMKRDKDPFGFKNLHYISRAQDSIALNDKSEPCVIISASGMADAGRVKHHIRHNIRQSRNTILLVGYCEPESLGGKLIRGDKEVSIYGDMYPVNARVEVMRTLSAHGDYQDLLRFLKCQNPALVKKIFIVHGEPEVQKNFSAKLRNQQFQHIEIPAMHQTFSLD